MVVYREDCTALSAQNVRHRRTARVAVTGPLNLGVILWPENAAIAWYWRGTRFNVKVRRVPSQSGHRLWQCPRCGAQVFTVFFMPPAFVCCRHCVTLRYRQWDRSGRCREPRTPHLWNAWAARRLERLARRHKVSLKEAGAGDSQAGT